MYTKEKLLTLLYKSYKESAIRVLEICMEDHEEIDMAFTWSSSDEPDLWRDYYEGRRLEEGVFRLQEMIDILEDKPPPDIDDFL